MERKIRVSPTMGKKKRGKRNTANNTAISHDRVAGHDDEQCDTILNCMPDKAECVEPFHIDECNKSPKKEELLIEVVPTTTTTTSVSVGDTVKIKGLVNAPEYNGRRGVIVSELDATTNRCGVRITGKNSKVMAIQVTNLTLERIAKKTTIENNSNDRVGGNLKVQSDSVREEIHDFEHADSDNAKLVTRIMKDLRKCKKDAVELVLSFFDVEGENKWFHLTLVNNGLVSVLLGFLTQCVHEDFNDVVKKVKGNLRTPVDWIEILAHLGLYEQCKVEIASGIQTVIRCLCDDSKRLFFKSNKYWHEAMPPFLTLVSNLLVPSEDKPSNAITVTVYSVLLQYEGFLESIVEKNFLSSYRPDIVKEYESHQLSVDSKTLQAFAHKLIRNDIKTLEYCAYIVIRNIIVIGNKRNATELDNELNSSISQDGMDLIKHIAKTPVVSRAYDPGCKVYFVVGLIRMLKNDNSRDSADRKDHFAILIMLTVCFDNYAIAEVVDLGRRCTANIDDAINISRLSHCMLLRKNTHGNVYPIDRRIAFAIKSGLLEMCFDFITRFACNPTIQSIACDAKRDELIRHLVHIAHIIQAVALHLNTSKAIRDRWWQTSDALLPLIPQLKSEQSLQFVEILSSIMDLNEGSCSRCNKPIEWRTALFCEGCRRVAYCGVKCQKEDWRFGTHSSDCSFLARSADVLELTTFEVKSSRNKSELTGLRNNIVTSQKKLFLRHKSSLFSQLLNYPDRSDYIAVFDLSNKQKPITVEHYHDQFKCSKQRKWFEEFRSSDKVVCMFTSQIVNGEINEEGLINRIGLYATFSIPDRIQLGLRLGVVSLDDIEALK
jgi:hypothetical protein